MHPFLKIGFRTLLVLGVSTVLFTSILWIPSEAKQTSDPTSTATASAAGAYITVIYIEPINVRSGPSSFDYPVIGTIPVGATAPALGRSPAGEWVQISFPAGPDGLGWVYAANVKLTSNALLPVVAPPSTPTPAVSPTPNATFVAALQPQATVTRKPTFTAPPPLSIPTYGKAGTTTGKLQLAWVIIVMAVIGLFGMAISVLLRKR